MPTPSTSSSDTSPPVSGSRSHHASGQTTLGSRRTTTPSDAAPEPYQPGTKVGRYVLEERVGIGGMGMVYAAFDPELDRRVAVKVLLGPTHDDGQTTRSDGRRRLLREAQAMARLTHPNVVTVHDVGVVDERVFVAMEFVEGGTLGEWRQRPHTLERILAVFCAAARGLQAAHDAGLVHRDF
ncbi:MAG: protein kinase, partial [Myxococcota bacterium]